MAILCLVNTCFYVMLLSSARNKDFFLRTKWLTSRAQHAFNKHASERTQQEFLLCVWLVNYFFTTS